MMSKAAMTIVLFVVSHKYVFSNEMSQIFASLKMQEPIELLSKHVVGYLQYSNLNYCTQKSLSIFQVTNGWR